jgi:hypothetical protein
MNHYKSDIRIMIKVRIDNAQAHTYSPPLPHLPSLHHFVIYEHMNMCSYVHMFYGISVVKK